MEQVDSDSYLVLSTINNVTFKEAEKEECIQERLDSCPAAITTVDNHDGYLILNQDIKNEVKSSKTVSRDFEKDFKTLHQDKQAVSTHEVSLEDMQNVEPGKQVVSTSERSLENVE